MKFLCEGGLADLFVVCFFRGQSADEFGPELMGKLADLGLALSLDFYPPDTTKNVIPGEREHQ
jgi:hypothetical protein